MEEETSVQRIVKAKKEGVIDHLGATDSEKFHREGDVWTGSGVARREGPSMQGIAETWESHWGIINGGRSGIFATWSGTFKTPPPLLYKPIFRDNHEIKWIIIKARVEMQSMTFSL